MTTTDDAGFGERAGNEDMAALHGRLIALVASLESAIDDARDPAAVHALDARIAETNLRVDAVQRQLFAARTAELAAAARDVVAAMPRIEEALADLARMDEALAGVTGALALVDKAVAVCKPA